jgi:hypothetical protein
MPDRLKVKLPYIETASYSDTAFNKVLFGVSGTGARIPKYWGNYFSIYKFAYIDAIHMHFEIVNTGTTAGSVALAEGNTVDSVSVDMSEIARTPRSLFRTTFPAGNRSVTTLSYTARARDLVGHRVEDSQSYWTRETTGPSAPVLPVMVLGWEPMVAATTFRLSWTLKISYDLSFFGINPQ